VRLRLIVYGIEIWRGAVHHTGTGIANQQLGVTVCQNIKDLVMFSRKTWVGGLPH